MEEILKIAVTVLGTIIVAGGSVIVAYFNKLKRKLDEAKVEGKKHETEIKNLHNGFRESVYTELKKLNNKECPNCKKKVS